MGEQLLERLTGQISWSKTGVNQCPGKETGIEQVQDGVFDATDVLVNRHPRLGGFSAKGDVFLEWVSEPQEVPRRVDKGVHRVGLPLSRTVARWARGVEKRFIGCEWRLAIGQELDVVGSEHGQLLNRDGHNPTRRTVHHWNGATPEPLTRHQPVTESVVDGCVTNALLDQPRNRLGLRFVNVEAIQEATVDLLALPAVGLAASFFKAFRHLRRADNGQREGLGKRPVTLVF